MAFATTTLIDTGVQIHITHHMLHTHPRQYCQRRLRKLYVSTKILHGRGKFTAKTIDAAMVTDARCVGIRFSTTPTPPHRVLHIPLINAERAWAYAQALKARAAEKPTSSLRNRALGRLARASRSARELAALAAQTCDDITRAEAAAYASWMTALWLAERGQDWPRALAQHQRARCLVPCALSLAHTHDVGTFWRRWTVWVIMTCKTPCASWCSRSSPQPVFVPTSSNARVRRYPGQMH